MQSHSSYPYTADIRQFLSEAFNDEELTTLCFDYFPVVHGDFTASMRKGQKIQLLLDYCQRYEVIPNLLAAISKARPEQYDQRFPQVPQVELPLEAPKLQRDPKQIFISYAHEDAEFAHRLAGDLRQRGWHVWIVPDSIRPGEKWVDAIERGFDESGVFVVVVTPAATKSRWVKSETNAAIELEHRGQLQFIPLEVTPCNVPILWTMYQHISFVGRYGSGLVALISELELRWWEREEPKEVGRASIEGRTHQKAAQQARPTTREAGQEAKQPAKFLGEEAKAERTEPSRQEHKAREITIGEEKTTVLSRARRVPTWAWGGLVAFILLSLLIGIFRSGIFGGSGATPTVLPTTTLPIALATVTPTLTQIPRPSDTPAATIMSSATPSLTLSPTPSVASPTVTRTATATSTPTWTPRPIKPPTLAVSTLTPTSTYLAPTTNDVWNFQAQDISGSEIQVTVDYSYNGGCDDQGFYLLSTATGPLNWNCNGCNPYGQSTAITKKGYGSATFRLVCQRPYCESGITSDAVWVAIYCYHSGNGGVNKYFPYTKTWWAAP